MRVATVFFIAGCSPSYTNVIFDRVEVQSGIALFYAGDDLAAIVNLGLVQHVDVSALKAEVNA